MGQTGDRIVALLKAIPYGNVASYGQIAAMAGIHNGARTVARVLHSSSAARDLAWWRVLRSDGTIALPQGGGFEEQTARLAAEGIPAPNGRVDLEQFGWKG